MNARWTSLIIRRCSLRNTKCTSFPRLSRLLLFEFPFLFFLPLQNFNCCSLRHIIYFSYARCKPLLGALSTYLVIFLQTQEEVYKPQFVLIINTLIFRYVHAQLYYQRYDVTTCVYSTYLHSLNILHRYYSINLINHAGVLIS